MSRTEFSRQTKRDAFARALGCCERCGMKLRAGEAEYDHVIADGLGGDNSLDNCGVLCKPCHRAKTSGNDVPKIAKAKRIADREIGIRRKSKWRSAGFRKAASQRSASRPLHRKNDFSNQIGE